MILSNKIIEKEAKMKKKGRNVGGTNNQTKIEMQKLMEIFKDKLNIVQGLTKEETIALYYQMPLATVLKKDKIKIRQLWLQIEDRKKALRKNGLMAIVSQWVIGGAVLTNSQLGRRVMPKSCSVYHRCYNFDDANKVKARYDSIIQGIESAEGDITTITERDIAQPQLIKVLNHNQKGGKTQ